MTSEDARLVAGARNGDPRSFEALYDKYRIPVYRTALGITHDPGLAEEVLQDCFLRAYDCLARLNPAPSIGPWLHRVTVNICFNQLRRRRNNLVPLDAVGHTLSCPAMTSSEMLYVQSEWRETLKDSLSSLSSSHRRVIVMHYLQGFALDEIATMLECPVGTVKSRLHYARRCLGDALRSSDLAWGYGIA